MGSLGSERVGHNLTRTHVSLVTRWHMGIVVPQPGIEPTSPELESGFLTTGPHGKFQRVLIWEASLGC